MACEFFEEVQAFHDGELVPARAQRFEAHLLAGCASCQAELQSLRTISQLISDDVPMMEMSADARARLHVAVDRAVEQFGDYRLMPLARGLVAIAAAVLIGATAGLLYVPRQPVSPPQPWEGALLTSSQQPTIETTSATGIDPDLIVADLSRPSRH